MLYLGAHLWIQHPTRYVAAALVRQLNQNAIMLLARGTPQDPDTLAKQRVERIVNLCGI